jgi:tRNA1(Val) A37 N6-methylase TrmN6
MAKSKAATAQIGSLFDRLDAEQVESSLVDAELTEAAPEETQDIEPEQEPEEREREDRQAETNLDALATVLDDMRNDGVTLATQAVLDEALPFKLQADYSGLVYTREQIIDEAFRWFRANGFPYRVLPKFVMMQQINALATAPEGSLPQSSEAYSVADTFNIHRFHSTVDGKNSPFECFNNDVKFRHALEMRLDRQEIPAGFFTEITLSRNTQQCSNFRPGFAAWLYRRFCKTGDTVLDTSTGYGGRLVGFIASRVNGHYIGIDPSTPTYHANLQLAETLEVKDRVTLIHAAVEDVDVETLRGRCDFSFTSPPYFSKEHYSDEDTQSWKRYGHSYLSWVKGFLIPMLRLTFIALKPGSHALVNIEDVKIKSKKYPTVQSTIDEAVAQGFQFVASEKFRMQPRLGAHQEADVATERVLVFYKP